MTIQTTITRCAVCGQPLTEVEATPHALGETLLYHADYDACMQYTLAQLATRRQVTAVMAAAVGAQEVQS
jgi:hypothetical protein